jgi:hypothetical protein
MSNARKYKVFYKEHGDKYQRMLEFEGRNIAIVYHKFKAKFPDIEPSTVTRA